MKIASEIMEIKQRLSLPIVETKKNPSKPADPPVRAESHGNSPEPDTRTRRQEEKLSKAVLERTRRELEDDILATEKEIEDLKKKISAAESRIQSDTEKIQAIRQVLEIFKEKDKIYA